MYTKKFKLYLNQGCKNNPGNIEQLSIVEKNNRKPS